MSQPVKKPIHWAWIIIALIIFWPLGLFLLFRRVTNDRSAVLKGTGFITFIAIMLLLVGVANLLLLAEGGGISNLAAVVLMIGGGIWLLHTADKINKRGRRYKRYIDLIVNQSRTYIDDLAAEVKQPYESVVADLEEMIQLGYFKSAYIDSSSRRIIARPPDIQEPASESPNAPAAKRRLVTCTGCGANNAVVDVGECEYCGTMLV